MSRRRPRPTSPVPARDGISPTRIRIPADAEPRTLAEYLTARFPPHDAAATRALFGRGDVFGPDGFPLDAAAPLRPGGHVWVFRPLPEEPPVPHDLPVLYQDEHLLVVDKPHGLPVTPRGGFVQQTVVTLLRRETGNPLISPAHRLDRMTAGVLVLTTTREARGPVQGQFERREVAKSYELLAPWRPVPGTPGMRPGPAPEIPLAPDPPLPVVSRLHKPEGSLRTLEIPGPANARTGVVLLERRGEIARYAAYPETGRTHQIRVHLAALGRPILGDPLYGPHPVREAEHPHPAPEPGHPRPCSAAEPPNAGTVRDRPRPGTGPGARPLQLLAREISFRHPVTGEQITVRSRRELSWPVPGPDLGPDAVPTEA